MNTPQPLNKHALLPALGCYSLWGFFPVYWKLLSHVDAMETLTHRIIWSFIFYIAIMAARVLWSKAFAQPVTKRDWLLALFTGVLMAVNWGVYIYAMNIDRIIESSLAYFINPLMSVAVGVFIFREPFPKLLKVAFVMALIGVGIQIGYGDHFPWIALILATSFCIYGAIKKIITVNATQFSMMESAVVLLPALIFAVMLRSDSDMPLEQLDWILLAGGGVITGIPLLLFAMAAQRLPYSVMGMLQFIGPTIQFGLGYWLYEEPINLAGWVSFGFIWGGVGLYLMDRIRVARALRKKSRVPLAVPQSPK